MILAIAELNEWALFKMFLKRNCNEIHLAEDSSSRFYLSVTEIPIRCN